jgi:membrane protein DedA with SNARE-associated domain
MEQLTEFVATYGIWLVAAFIALETIGAPLPAEAALMAAAFLAARTHDFAIWSLIAAGILAAIVGNIAGFWLGRRFGPRLLLRHGARFGLTEQRLKIGQWLFVRYGGRFVFTARFLPFLRNMAAVLAGANSMSPPKFYLVSGIAAAAWVTCYGLATYWLSEAFMDIASSAAIVLALAAILIVVAVPMLIMRYEERLLAHIADGSPGPPFPLFK